MTANTRIYSIDIMRGLTLVLMLFVNDLYMPGVPEWLGHMKADFDGMGLADWVYPGFLFMVGMAIPFAIKNRFSKGEDTASVIKHIIIRSVSLIIIGVLTLNAGRVNAELTGMGENLWAILVLTGVFLVWNNYKETESNFFTIAGLRLAGIALLVFCVFKFRSGQVANNGSLITSWWGILGQIGWGYLAAALLYVAARDRIILNVAGWLFFLALNILYPLHLLEFMKPAKPVLGILIEGSVPFIVISGLLTTLIMKKLSADQRKFLLTTIAAGILCIITGFILRRWFIISKILATPSWGFICNGISLVVFSILYWIIDVKKKISWASFLRPAGENSLTTYLAPDILYYIIFSINVPVLIYKGSGIPIVVIAGSLAWALLMVGFTALLSRYGIRLKL